MGDYSSAQQSNNFSQSSAFAAALQRAKQIAAKIQPTGPTKRPHEDGQEPEAKKFMSNEYGSVGGAGGAGPGMNPAAAQMAAAVAARLSQSAGNMTSEDIRIPDQAVGLVIGRGGEQITRLQNESGCKIQMNNESGERLCTLTGPRESIGRAKEMIQKIVSQHGNIETVRAAPGGPIGIPMTSNSSSGYSPTGSGSGGGGGGGGGGGNGSGGAGGGYQQYQEIMVPGPKVGLIIGKGGETIKMLQEKSGAKMVIIQDGPGQEMEKPLRITGDPAKVEHAKQLVFELIGDKGSFGGRGGGGGGGGGGGFNHGGMGGGGPGGDTTELNVFVPKSAVGVVIGKGGDMIKKIQNETGCKLQFLQGRNDEPGDRRCIIQGTQQQVEDGKSMIDELIESVLRRENGERGGGGGGSRNGNYGGGGGYGQGGGGGGGHGRDEAIFIVPASKCGIIIGRGGDTIKQINQQSGAFCEMDRKSQSNTTEKQFNVKGSAEQIESARRIICEKIGMQIKVIGGEGGGSSGGSNYGSSGGGGNNPYQQQWGQQYGQQWGSESAGGGQQQQQHQQSMQMPGGAAQADFSQQWIEYYRSMGMHREAEIIEQQLKAKQGGTVGGGPSGAAPAPAAAAPTNGAATMGGAGGAAAATAAGVPDYSAQWAEYYRSIGKVDEAEAIENQIKANKGGAATPAGVYSAAGGGAAPNAAALYGAAAAAASYNQYYGSIGPGQAPGPAASQGAYSQGYGGYGGGGGGSGGGGGRSNGNGSSSPSKD